MAKRCGVIGEDAVQFMRVGVEQQLVDVEPMPLMRREPPFGAVAVDGTRLQPGQVAVPHRASTFGQRDAPLLAFSVRRKQAQKHLRRVFGKHRKIYAAAIEMCAKPIGSARFKLHRNGGVIGHCKRSS